MCWDFQGVYKVIEIFLALNFTNSYYQKVDTRTHLSSDEIEMLPIKLRIIYILISDLDIRDIDYLDEKKN